MDVRCERCKTEYEFDDAKVTEAGVTVKCTTCSHVFKVKKRSLVVTVPVSPEDAANAELPPVSAPVGAPPREWKVRQANGNVYSFKELTTLQKWIVERKVKRDDDISLNGETWKRLGNIAELSAFFQVVDEASKAEQLGALAQAQAAQAQALAAQVQAAAAAAAVQTPPPAPAVAIPPPAQLFSPPPVPTAELPAHPAPIPSPTQVPATEGSPLANAVVSALPLHTAAAQVVSFPARADSPPPQVVVVQVPTQPQLPIPPDAVRSARREPERSGGLGKVLVGLLVLGLLGAGAWYGYTEVYLKQEQEKQALQQANSAISARAAMAEQQKQELQDEHERARTEADEKARLEAEEKARLEAEAKAKQEQDAAAATADVTASPVAIDAGTPAPAEPAGVAAAEKLVVPAEKPAEPKARPAPKREPRSYDYYMTQGDKLREREKLSAAMDAYGNAADMQPNRAEPVTGRALVLLDLGNKLQAEAAFQQALKLNPGYAVAVMGLAETYRSMGRNQDAIRYYQRYLELLPNGPEANVARSAVERLK